MKKSKCQCKNCLDQEDRMQRIRTRIDRIFNYIHSPDYYDDCSCNGSPIQKLSEAKEKPEEAQGFRYIQKGGYPIVSQILKKYGRSYSGDLNNIRKFSTSESKKELFRQLRNLGDLGLINYVLSRDCSDYSIYYLNLEVTDKGVSWVLEKECA